VSSTSVPDPRPSPIALLPVDAQHARPFLISLFRFNDIKQCFWLDVLRYLGLVANKPCNSICQVSPEFWTRASIPGEVGWEGRCAWQFKSLRRHYGMETMRAYLADHHGF
jgi:hypothetical protein